VPFVRNGRGLQALRGSSTLASQLLSKIALCSVYYEVSKLLAPPIQDIYLVELVRRPGDIGASVLVHVNCRVVAKPEVWRPFPEYKRRSSGTFVHLLDDSEIDLETGRCFVAKRKKRTGPPVFGLDEPTRRLGITRHGERAQ
jgi:hypothetical protein